jgi:hypothetical protein
MNETEEAVHPLELSEGEEWIWEVSLRLSRWQEADTDGPEHPEKSRLATWNRGDGRIYLTATTGRAVVAVDCTGYSAECIPYGRVHENVARVLEAETHAPDVVDLIAFWDWLGEPSVAVHGECLSCSMRIGKVFGTPYNLAVIRGALGSVWDFLDRDAEADWGRLVQPQDGNDRHRTA